VKTLVRDGEKKCDSARRIAGTIIKVAAPQLKKKTSQINRAKQRKHHR
jgi:hypothetical protein